MKYFQIIVGVGPSYCAGCDLPATVIAVLRNSSVQVGMMIVGRGRVECSGDNSGVFCLVNRKYAITIMILRQGRSQTPVRQS